MQSQYQAVWIDGKRYCRQTYADGTKGYAVHSWIGPEIGGRGVWRTLPARCKNTMARIDKALDQLST